MKITAENIKSNVPGIVAPEGLEFSINADPKTFFDIEVPIRANYYDGFGSVLEPPVVARLGTYLEDATTNVFKADHLCPEIPVPPEISQHCSLKLSKKVPGGSDHAVALLHVGRSGCIAPLHFDWDHDSVLHCCVFGRRTIFLIPPDAGWLLTPVINTSALCFARFSPEDRKALLEMVGGFEITLEPGEAVLFPSMWWHSVYYNEASIGVSVRFADRTDFRPFSALPRSWWLQRLVGELFISKASASSVAGVLRGCLEVFFKDYSVWTDRHQAFNNYCRDQLLSLGKQKGTQYWADPAFVPELAIAGFELERFYTVSPNNSASDMEIESVINYLFEKDPQSADLSLVTSLARQALNVRSGLPPKKGLIPFSYEISDR